jgi:hypothetical protein
MNVQIVADFVFPIEKMIDENENEIKFVSNNPDYYIVINNCRKYYRPEKSIVFYMEPNCESYYQNWGVKTWNKIDPKSVIDNRDHKTYLNILEWHLPKTITQLKTESIEKTKTISAITSSKYYDPGHIVRIKLLQFLENQNFNIDIYGYSNGFGFKQYKGALEMKDKDKGLYPYKYHIHCENNSEYNYATEKLWDGILSECVVFYWGCPNIEDYIDNACFIRLHSTDHVKNLQTISNSIMNNEWEKRIDRIRIQKRKLLVNFNIVNIIKQVIYRQSSTPIDIWIRCYDEYSFKKIFNQIRCNLLYDRCRMIYVCLTGIDKFECISRKVKVFHISPFTEESDYKILKFFKFNCLSPNTNIIYINSKEDIDLSNWNSFIFNQSQNTSFNFWCMNSTLIQRC